MPKDDMRLVDDGKYYDMWSFWPKKVFTPQENSHTSFLLQMMIARAMMLQRPHHKQVL